MSRRDRGDGAPVLRSRDAAHRLPRRGVTRPAGSSWRRGEAAPAGYAGTVADPTGVVAARRRCRRTASTAQCWPTGDGGASSAPGAGRRTVEVADVLVGEGPAHLGVNMVRLL